MAKIRWLGLGNSELRAAPSHCLIRGGINYPDAFMVLLIEDWAIFILTHTWKC